MDPDIINLAKQIKFGDKNAFRQLYEAYFLKLEHFAVQYVIDFYAANDLVQNVFVILWEKRASIREDAGLIGYLYTMTRNHCLNYLNHKKTEKKYQQEIQEKNEREWRLNKCALEFFDYERLQENELRTIINKAIEELPETSREVFLMNRKGGLTYGEIAQKLNISDKTVEKRMSKALALLRISLKEYYFLIFFL
ncbi:MAG: RNA polymerase sigma-70 factor [Bacteroidales bacterium]|nr:RNA polymerase sigma-70 factor [Bacteroidales bacterium]MDD2424423.1 RNA polymerase sigma-70 factor [Bacteroidales bacterium]MDD3989005.1 RNA polymerase sigma-70 factor [Bacteroidales bacterium]MDD4638796.1 RNA polymerase sigma-70 factor [Bacteroidales bacterium]